MSKINILLTGGAGYIGSNVANLLISKGYSVTIIDSLITGNKKLINKKADFVKCDLKNQKKINNLLNKKKFDLVLHFAGLIRVDESVKKPKKYYDYNFKRSKVFFNTCIKNGIKKFVFSSTASVYGNIKKNKVLEKNKLNPINPYAKSKLMVENFLIKKSKIDKIKFVILRYFNVAGADKKLKSGLMSKYSTHLIKIISEVVTGKKKQLIINGSDYNTKDGTTIRDYIHVSDLAEIHLVVSKYLLKGKSSQIFNCGYGRGFSVLQVMEQANKISKKKIKFKFGPRRKGDIAKLIANVSKFNKFFKWKPKYNSLDKIVQSSIAWEKKLKNYL